MADKQDRLERWRRCSGEWAPRAAARLQGWTSACLIAAASAVVAASCSSGGTTNLEVAPLEATAEPAPLYAILGTTFGADGMSRASYIALVPSLDASTNIDYGAVLETAGTETPIAGVPGSGQFFNFDAEAVELKRYSVSRDGSFGDTASLGLQAAGVTGGAFTSLWIVSASKGYFYDPGSLQLFAFDPNTMTLLATIPIPELAQGMLPAYAAFGGPLLRGKQLVFMTYYTDLQADTVEPSVRLVLVDTETDAVRVSSDDRCGGLAFAVSQPNGDIYFASDAWAAAVHRLGGGPASCILRLNANENALDPSFQQSMADLTGVETSGGLIPGPGSTAFVRELDESIFPVPADADVITLFGAPAWRTARITLGENTPGSEVDRPGPTGGGVTWFLVDGESYTNDSSPDFSTSTLLKMNDSGDTGGSPGLSVRGVPFGVLRVW